MELNNPMLIVIDPGHGGYDNGASYNGRLEKDDNLRLGLAVRDALMAQGIDVLMTRDADVFVPLANRAAMANNNDADLFVSLHRSSAEQPSDTTYGVENYIYLTAPNETTGEAARKVLNAVDGVGVQGNRGVSRGNYYVLRRIRMPAMLLEMGFIINEEDNRLFGENLEAYAQAITMGVMDYFGLTYAPPNIVNPLPPAEPAPPIEALPLNAEPLPPIETISSKVTPPTGTFPSFDARSSQAQIEVRSQTPVRPAPPAQPVPPIGTLPPNSNTILGAQQALNGYFAAQSPETGQRNSETKKALVRVVQTQLNNIYGAGLAVDGLYGERTANSMPILRPDDTGSFTLLLEIALGLKGYDPGGYSGTYDARVTRPAVQMYQRDNYLVPDGVVGQSTWTRLLG